MINNIEINNIIKANMLNNREVGFLITIVLVIIICGITLKKDFLKRVRMFIEVFDIEIIIIIFSIFIWEILLLILLDRFNLWSINNLKDSIWWFFTTGIVVIFKVSFINKNDIYRYLINILFNCFSINLLIEFIYSNYIFSIPIEIFIWICISIEVFIKFSVKNEIYCKTTGENLNWLYDKIKILLYYGIIIGIIFSIIRNPQKLFKFKGLIINIILMASIILPTYLLHIYILYEKLFRKLCHNKNKKIVRYIKLRVFFYAKFNINKLEFDKFKKVFWLQKREDVKREFNEMER